MELSLLTYRAGQIPGGQILTTYLDNEIRLLPDITFTCSTVITSLALGIDVRSETEYNQYPSVLLVQPTHDVNGYTLLTEQTIYYTPDNVSTNGVYNYPLDPPISVNVSDILGVRAPRQGDSVVRIYYEYIANINYETQGFSITSDLSWQLDSKYYNQLVLVYPIAGKYNI